MKSTILLSFIHPAPYIDKWIKAIESVANPDVLYNHPTSKAKTWINYIPHTGFSLEELGYIRWCKYIIKHDNIVLSGWYDKINILSIILSFILRKNFAVFCDYPYEVKRLSLKWYMKKIILFFIPKLFCATKSTMSYYKTTFGYSYKNMFFFPYASEEVNDNIAQINTKRNQIIKNGGQIRVFIANNFRKRKGYKTLLASFEILKTKNLLSKIDITIAGNGDEYKYYHEKLKALNNNIKFVGWTSNEEYEAYMNNTDIFIHCSDFEPFGIPPIDAMKRGKLLIVSNGVKSVDEVICNGINGYSFMPKDHTKLAQIMQQLIASPSLVYKLGEKAKKDAESEYSNQIYVNSIKAFIHEQ